MNDFLFSKPVTQPPPILHLYKEFHAESKQKV